MDNNTSSDQNAAARGPSTGDYLAIIALVVSLIALLGTFAQVAQQYYSSAAGYSNCGESVMGLWHKSKKRKFRYSELRFEVQFETPVIFVCPPTNVNGPVKGSPIHYIEGTTASLGETRTMLPVEDQKARDEQVLRANRVHTADNERATWVTMLSQLQLMERDSQEWQRTQYGQNPPSSQPQAVFNQHTLAVALQSKKRSWDTMPSNVKKPYATTAMCHLIEIAAMLGLYWKEFNRSTDRYRAEGNGYILIGTNVDDLGIMFALQICGKSKFRENRIIPVDEVKELCCGFISTIFRKDQDSRRLEFPDEEPRDLSILQVGSTNDVAETLVLIGCNTNTANYFRSEKAKHGHLFPVAFELLGMLGKNLHIPNSCFRLLPNPTPYHWDKKFFSLRKLLQEYRKKVSDDDLTLQNEQVRRLTRLAEIVEGELGLAPQDFCIPLLDALHSAVQECEVFLKEHISRELVTMVVREHFQEVLRMINEEESGSDGESLNDDAVLPTSPITGLDYHRDVTDRGSRRTPRFNDLNAASPEEKQEKFMDIYFAVVLPRVMRQAVDSFKRRKTTRYAPSHHGRDPSTGSNRSAVPQPPTSSSSTAGSPPPLPYENSIPFLQISTVEEKDAMSGEFRSGSRKLRSMDTETLDTQANNIWCTLVFRMLCWLLLHDFHKKDVQISKSELLGSRLPVYIA